MNVGQYRICAEVFHPKAHVDTLIKETDQRQRAVFLIGTWWEPLAKLRVSFLASTGNVPKFSSTEQLLRGSRSGESLDPLEEVIRGLSPQEAVKKVILERIQPLVGLKIEFVDSDGDIRIRFDSMGGSASLVGMQSLQAPQGEWTMTFGWLDVGTIEHEFCHALGMVHEHSSPYGGIDWDVPKVYEWAARTQGWDKSVTDTNILAKYNSDQVNGSQFDPTSVMLYFYPAELTKNKQAVYHNNKLSPTDQEWLSSIYPKDGQRKLPLQGAGLYGVSQRSRIWVFIVLMLLFVVLCVLVVLWRK